jgi:hypothetical protein
MVGARRRGKKEESCDKGKGQKVRKTIPTSQLLEKFSVGQYSTFK